MTGPPGLAELGLPASRGWLTVEAGPLAGPGEVLAFAFGLHAGIAPVRGRFVLRLERDGVVVASEAAVVRLGLSSRQGVGLSVRVPREVPAAYTLVLEHDDQSWSWPVTVPEQRVDVEVEVSPSPVPRGARAMVRWWNRGPHELLTGPGYTLHRRAGDDWVSVDPFDGEDAGWAAVGIGVAPGERGSFPFDVPRLTEPGLHRLSLWFMDEEHGVRDARPSATFEVV